MKVGEESLLIMAGDGTKRRSRSSHRDTGPSAWDTISGKATKEPLPRDLQGIARVFTGERHISGESDIVIHSEHVN